MALNLVHLNGNTMCAVSIVTSGTIPRYHTVMQVCLLPLDSNLEPRQDIPPFDVYIKPRNIDYDSLKRNKSVLEQAVETGLEPSKAFELFEHWFMRLGLKVNKMITPLTFNWAYYSQFVEDWAGYENYKYYFHPYARDLLTVANYRNDLGDFQATGIPFPDVITVTMLAGRLGVEVIDDTPHDAVYRALLSGRVYKALLKDLVAL